jgi:hypothetical protein
MLGLHAPLGLPVAVTSDPPYTFIPYAPGAKMAEEEVDLIFPAYTEH